MGVFRLSLDELLSMSLTEYQLRVDSYLLAQEDELEREMALRAHFARFDSYNLRVIMQAVAGDTKGLDEGKAIDNIRKIYYMTKKEQEEAEAERKNQSDEEAKKRAKERAWAALSPEEKARKKAEKAKRDLQELMRERRK